MAGKVARAKDEISLVKIEGKVDLIRSGIDGIRKDLMKVVYSLIGVIAATFGSQFVHSPIHVIISSYVALFGAAFVIAATVWKWHSISIWNKLIRLLLSGHILFSVIARDMQIIYSPPEWYAIVINVFFAVISIVLVIAIWKEVC